MHDIGSQNIFFKIELVIIWHSFHSESKVIHFNRFFFKLNCVVLKTVFHDPDEDAEKDNNEHVNDDNG